MQRYLTTLVQLSLETDSSQLLKKLGEIFGDVVEDESIELLNEDAPVPVAVPSTMPNWESLVGDSEFVGMTLEDFKSQNYDTFNRRTKLNFS